MWSCCWWVLWDSPFSVWLMFCFFFALGEMSLISLETFRRLSLQKTNWGMFWRSGPHSNEVQQCKRCLIGCVCSVSLCFPLQLLYICHDSFVFSWFQKCEEFSSRQSRHSVCFFTLWRPVFSWPSPARSPPSSVGRGRLSLHPCCLGWKTFWLNLTDREQTSTAHFHILSVLLDVSPGMISATAVADRRPCAAWSALMGLVCSSYNRWSSTPVSLCRGEADWSCAAYTAEETSLV